MTPYTEETELPVDALPLPAWREALQVVKREVRTFLPVWMYFAYACLLLNTELTAFEPPRVDLAATVVFPLAVFVFFNVMRGLYAPDVTQRGRFIVLTTGVALGLPLLNLSHFSPSPLSRDALLACYEYSNFAWALLLGWHAWKRSPSLVALFFGVGLVYGALLENGGIVLGFFHEQNLVRTQVGPFPAPVATMIGWCVVLYMAMFPVWRLRTWVPMLKRSALLSAALVAGFATLLDLQIDPLATALGCWVWHASLPGWFHGVPLANFVAWLCALFPLAYVLFRIQDLSGVRDGKAWPRPVLWRALAAVPAALVLAALLFVGSTLVLEGPVGPSWELLSSFTSSLLAAWW
ncbi:MAG: carotenoid biosynthesis protein [Archangium sp.]|nr:carotenoid biosynthesis protein [Archangium sp.]